jgi:hypothetical protein
MGHGACEFRASRGDEPLIRLQKIMRELDRAGGGTYFAAPQKPLLNSGNKRPS